MAKARMRKMSTFISGVRVRCSNRTKATSRSTPTTMHRIVAALPHPHVADCWNPITLRATPPTISARPR